MPSTLSVCFLTRNEEATIARAIGSVTGVADQVLVVDTHSRDRTVQIATSLGAEISLFSWEDDFSAGRNFTIGRATRDWILWMNAEEELPASSHQALRDALAREDAFGYFVIIQNLSRPDRIDLFSETADLRLFRKRADLQFAGRLHPHLAPAVVETIARDGVKVLPSRITIRSHAHLSAPTEAKIRWTIRLLELELRDRPGQLHYMIEYGKTLLLLGDASGHHVLAEAIDQVVACRDAPAAPSRKVQVLLEYVLTASPDVYQGKLSRAEARALAVRWFPQTPPLLWRIAEQYIETREFSRAAEILERLVHLGKTSSYERSAKFNLEIVGDAAVMNLAICHANLREFDRAERAFFASLLTTRSSALRRFGTSRP